MNQLFTFFSLGLLCQTKYFGLIENVEITSKFACKIREFITVFVSDTVKRALLYTAQQPGIERTKKEALLKLCKENLIPEEYWSFFQNLRVNGADTSDSEEDNDNEL